MVAKVRSFSCCVIASVLFPHCDPQTHPALQLRLHAHVSSFADYFDGILVGVYHVRALDF